MGKNIFCIGELLVDMVSTDNVGLRKALHFEKNAGGAPANVACCAARLGAKSYFLGQVGNDFFGDFLFDTLHDFNVDTSMAKELGHTTISFVDLDEDGERNFSFIRGSDEEYAFKNINIEVFKPLDIIHFGSATALLGGELKKTYTNLLYLANDIGDFISFDPNYRDSLLSDDLLPKYKKDCIGYITRSDLVKLSEEELTILVGTSDVFEGATILNDLGARVVCVTLGEKGTLLSVDGKQNMIETIKIKQVDSTGAGDAFIGGILYKLSIQDENIKRLDFDTWCEIVRFANKVGAISCTKYGALSALPTLEEVI